MFKVGDSVTISCNSESWPGVWRIVSKNQFGVWDWNVDREDSEESSCADEKEMTFVGEREGEWEFDL